MRDECGIIASDAVDRKCRIPRIEDLHRVGERRMQQGASEIQRAGSNHETRSGTFTANNQSVMISENIVLEYGDRILSRNIQWLKHDVEHPNGMGIHSHR